MMPTTAMRVGGGRRAFAPGGERRRGPTPAGRRAVTELLKTYELAESRRILIHGGEPVDYGFLWDGLGLQRADA